jgi:hypothetical protein
LKIPFPEPYIPPDSLRNRYQLLIIWRVFLPRTVCFNTFVAGKLQEKEDEQKSGKRIAHWEAIIISGASVLEPTLSRAINNKENVF